jgi:hypothetical protein
MCHTRAIVTFVVAKTCSEKLRGRQVTTVELEQDGATLV